MLERIAFKIWECWVIIVSIICFIPAVIVDLLIDISIIICGLTIGMQIRLSCGRVRDDELRNDLITHIDESVFTSYKFRVEFCSKLCRKIAGL